MLRFALISILVLITAAEPNPPSWPGNVYVFDPSTPSTTQSVVNQVYSQNGGHNPPFNGQWSSGRYAFLFKPGTHNVQVPVGYYTSIMGLGKTPTDVTIQNVYVENGDFDYTGGALANFWRSAENFKQGTNPMLWAVSQACPLRRLNLQGDINLYQYNSGCCAGYASGGYLADSTITGTTTSGSQQQWFSRNSNFGKWNGGVWNMVFLGNNGAVPGSHCGDSGGSPYTTVGTTPVIAEKPFIIIDGTGKFYLQVPRTEYNKVGPTTNFDNADTIDFANVYVARETDTAATINSKLASGLHLLLTPGNYNLSTSIQITKPGTVVLGIGFPTMTPTGGQPVFTVGDVDGVRIGGILLQAGAIKTSTLLQWGSGSYGGNPVNPGFLHDVFARVGGTNNPAQYQVSTDNMIQLNNGNVIFDNTWLWRADHDITGNVYNGNNPVNHGLVVNGQNVSVYGLAVEHTLQDLVQWNANLGQVYFYQSELPYDVTEAQFGTPGYVGYRVSSSVQTHNVWGAGVYSYFRDYSVTTNSGIGCPSAAGIKFVNSFTVWLNGNGQISHVVNNEGNAVYSGNQLSYVCTN